jgi:nitrate/nitrite transporter NarK
MIVAGVTLMGVSYFGLTAPWGVSSVANSDPRIPFAPAIFVVGVMLAFGSALVYEMLPDRFDRK